MGQDEATKSVITEIAASPSASFLIRMAEGDSLLTGLYLFQTLVNEQNKRGIYLSCNANSPYHFLDQYFGAHQIDTSKVIFIDTVSRPILGRHTAAKENAFFTQGNITEDAMSVLKELAYSVDDLSFVYFDSLTEMLKFHSEDEVTGFLTELVKLTKQRKMTGVILSFYGEREAELVKSFINYCDRCIDL